MKRFLSKIMLGAALVSLAACSSSSETHWDFGVYYNDLSTPYFVNDFGEKIYFGGTYISSLDGRIRALMYYGDKEALASADSYSGALYDYIFYPSSEITFDDYDHYTDPVLSYSTNGSVISDPIVYNNFLEIDFDIYLYRENANEGDTYSEWDVQLVVEDWDSEEKTVHMALKYFGNQAEDEEPSTRESTLVCFDLLPLTYYYNFETTDGTNPITYDVIVTYTYEDDNGEVSEKSFTSQWTPAAPFRTR